MRTSLKHLSIFVIVMMFFAVMSGGCGGGGGGDGRESNNVSQENGNNSGWDTDPDEQNQNQNQNQDQNQNNNNGDNNNDNQNGNNNGDNGNNDNGNQNNGSPVTISGTWEIVSGYAIVSNDDGRTYSLTYKPGRIGKIGINMSQNNNQTYYGLYDRLYTLKLSGENVMGGMALIIDYTYDDAPDSTIPLSFTAQQGYSYIGNGSYEMTDKDLQINFNGYFFRSTLTLENPSTLRWTYWQRGNEAQLGRTMNEVLEVLVFKKVQ